jgi:Flp pilus assembly protein TadB
MTRRSKQSYRTSLGGTISLLIFSLMLIYSILALVELFDAQESENKRSSARMRNLETIQTTTNNERKLDSSVKWDYNLNMKAERVVARTMNQNTTYYPFINGFQVGVRWSQRNNFTTSYTQDYYISFEFK